MKVTKEQVIAQIKRISSETGKPPGIQRFEALTGIGRRAVVGPLWRNWSEALVAAGESPNTLQPATDLDHLLRVLAQECRELGRFPSDNDMRFANKNKAEFPSTSTFQLRIGSKEDRVLALRSWIDENAEYSDVLPLLPSVQPTPKADEPAVVDSPALAGFVYLIKRGRFYYIGQTNDVDRRLNEHDRNLPERQKLVHKIASPYPWAIERYWHARFRDKRHRGDWFLLDPEDVQAFIREEHI